METTDNRRKNSRVAFQATISLDFPDQSHEECETQDLSLKGVYVQGVTNRKVGDTCLVSLRLSGSTSDLMLKMKGEVVRTDDTGLALHFFEIDLDSFFHLKNILYYNSGDPDKLDEELSEKIQAYDPID